MRPSAVRLLSACVAAGLLAGLGSSAAVSSAAGVRQVAFKPAAASFISPGDGWVLGASGCSACAAVRKTADGGRTWTVLPSPRGQLPFEHPRPGDVSDIAFADSRNGFLFGPALLVSHDGGRSWKREAYPRCRLWLGAGYAFALTQRLANGRVRVWRARLGHDRWSQLAHTKGRERALPAFRLLDCCARRRRRDPFVLQPGDTGPASTTLGRIWISNDSGMHWQARPVPCRRRDGGAAVIAIAHNHSRTWLIDCYNNEQSSQQQNTQHHLFGTVNGGASWTGSPIPHTTTPPTYSSTMAPDTSFSLPSAPQTSWSARSTMATTGSSS